MNAVGGQDELVFDGHSVVLDDEGEVLARAPGFEEALLVVDVEPEEAVGRRLRDVRRRALAREREAVPELAGRARAALRDRLRSGCPERVAPLLDDLEQMRLALELGLRDYVDKNGFREIVVGVSGGIDSALTAALAVEALGAGARPLRLDAVAVHLGRDARRRAAARRALGTDFLELPIEPIVEGFRRGAGRAVRAAASRI